MLLRWGAAWTQAQPSTLDNPHQPRRRGGHEALLSAVNSASTASNPAATALQPFRNRPDFTPLQGNCFVIAFPPRHSSTGPTSDPTVFRAPTPKPLLCGVYGKFESIGHLLMPVRLWRPPLPPKKSFPALEPPFNPLKLKPVHTPGSTNWHPPVPQRSMQAAMTHITLHCQDRQGGGH